MGYVSTTLNVILDTELQSLFDSAQSIERGSEVIVDVRFQNTFVSENISDAAVWGLWVYNANVYFNPQGDGLYRALINTSSATPGEYQLRVNATKSWYESQILLITLKLVIPTEVMFEGNYSTTYGGQVGILVSFLDNESHVKLTSWQIQVNTTSTTSLINSTTYFVTIESTDIPMGTCYIRFNCSRSNYKTQIFTLPFTVNLGKLIVEFNASVTWYQNEEVRLRVELRNNFTLSLESGATINLLIFGENHSLIESTPGKYYHDLVLSVTPENYEGTFTIFLNKYQTEVEHITITVLEKAQTVVQLTVDPSIIEGTDLVITALLRFTNGSPAIDLPILFNFHISYSNAPDSDETHVGITNSSGIATTILSVPLAATNITINATFAGTPGITSGGEIKTTTVLPSVIPPNPLLLLGIVAIVSIIIISSVLFLRQRGILQKTISVDAEKIEDLFEDLMNINHLFIIHSVSGLSLFYRSYGVEAFKSDLISGFLNALSHFAEELGETESGYATHNYQGKSISIITCGILRAAFVGDHTISERFKRYSTRVLRSTIEEHQDTIANWNGSMKQIQKIGIEIEQKLGLPLFHVPLMIQESPTNGNRSLNSAFLRISEFSETVHMLTLNRIADKLGKKYIQTTLQLVKLGHLKALVELDFLTGSFDDQTDSD
jgi:hypothetical protein